MKRTRRLRNGNHGSTIAKPGRANKAHIIRISAISKLMALPRGHLRSHGSRPLHLFVSPSEPLSKFDLGLQLPSFSRPLLRRQAYQSFRRIGGRDPMFKVKHYESSDLRIILEPITASFFCAPVVSGWEFCNVNFSHHILMSIFFIIIIKSKSGLF